MWPTFGLRQALAGQPSHRGIASCASSDGPFRVLAKLQLDEPGHLLRGDALTIVHAAAIHGRQWRR